MKLQVSMFSDTYKFLMVKLESDQFSDKDKEIYKTVCVCIFKESLRRAKYLPNLLKRNASNQLTNDYVIEVTTDRVRKLRNEEEVDWEANVKFNMFVRKQLKSEFMMFMKASVTFGKVPAVYAVEYFKGIYDLDESDIKSENLIRYYHRYKK